MTPADIRALLNMLGRLVAWSENPEPDGEQGRAMWADAKALYTRLGGAS